MSRRGLVAGGLRGRHAGLPLATALLVAAGCAQPRDPGPPIWTFGQPDRTHVQVNPREAPTLSRLRERAVRPVEDTGDRAIDAPPPPGLDPELSRVADDPAALLMLDEALVELVSEAASAAATADAAAPASADDQREALALYVSGRQKLLAGEAGAAAADLRAATRLDPSSPEPWRELGEAQLLLGSRTDAVASFQRALDLGLEEPRLLEQIGGQWMDRGEPAKAAACFARALNADPEASDEALPTLLHAQLARALAATGRLAAARESLGRALVARERSTATSRYQQELISLLRREGDLWRESGDLALRLGRYVESLADYQRAASLPSLEGSDLSARQVYAAMRSGRPAEAALHALAGAVAAGRRVGERELALLRYTAEHGGVGPDMASALAELREVLPPTLGSSVAAGLVRAQASLLGPAGARQALRAYALDGHSSVEILTDLFSQHATAENAAKEAESLVRRDPFLAGRAADALLRTDHDPLDVLARLEASNSLPARLVAAELRFARGEAESAHRLVEAARGRGDAETAAALIRAQLVAVAGVGSGQDAAVPPLRSGARAEERRATARTLVVLERPAEALEALRPLVTSDATSPAVEDLLLAGELAAQLGLAADSERWFRRSLEADRFDDHAYAGLLELHGPGGAAVDVAKFAQATRELRQVAPDGRVANLIRARELIRRSQFSQAESLLTPLATENPADLNVLDLLVAAWSRQASAQDAAAIERAEAWFTGQLARRPRSPALLAGRSRLLQAAKRGDEAVSMLRESLSAEWHAQTSLALEVALRESEGGSAEADGLALVRLARLPETPSRAIDRAELLARQGRDAEAADLVLRGLPPDARLSQGDGARLAALASRLARSAESDGALREPALKLLRFVGELGVRLSPDLHDKRLVLLAAAESPNAIEMLEAVRAVAAAHPELRQTAYLRAASLLAGGGHGAAGLAILEHGAADLDRPNEEYYTEWLRLTARDGDAERARAFIDAAAADGSLAPMIARAADDLALSGGDVRAEAAYVLAILRTQLGRAEESIALYELALEYDPGHAWSCNNLGYHLVESGGDLARAETLLETAYRAMPGEASIIDSLAWLRYKQGRFRGEVDPATGEVVRPGAVDLLRRAAGTEAGQRNATILDHFGDALWADGQREAAAQVWSMAEQMAMAQLQIVGDGPERGEWLASLIASVRAKRAALREGLAPPIAPFELSGAADREDDN